MRMVLALSLLLFPAALSAAESEPLLTAESLSGKAMNLPHALQAPVNLLIIGFSRTSRQQTKAWATRLHDACNGSKSLACFDVAVIAGVPGLLKGFVAGRIRANTPKERQAHFLLVREHEDAWRELAGFEQAHKDDAWLLLLDGTKGDSKGKIIWRRHGPWSQQLQDQLLQHAVTDAQP